VGPRVGHAEDPSDVAQGQPVVVEFTGCGSDLSGCFGLGLGGAANEPVADPATGRLPPPSETTDDERSRSGSCTDPRHRPFSQ
jgi:hypothetical protein